MDIATTPSAAAVSTMPSAATVYDLQTSGVSWAAIAAGGVAAAAITLLLLALGTGIGLSAVSPWSDSGVSATTFKIGAGIYLCCVAVMSSAIGGYLAARLRTKWTGLHTNEVFFRDTAHGLIAWAFATLLSAIALGSATSHIMGGAATAIGGGAAAAATQASPAQLSVDQLLRPAPAAGGAASPASPAPNSNPANENAVRAELTRLWTSDFAQNGDLSNDDRAYVARMIATQTGMSQADAEKRVNDVVTQAKAAADKARKAAMELALWLTASLLLGAFAASLAAAEGGQLRDGSWNGRVLTPRQI